MLITYVCSFIWPPTVALNIATSRICVTIQFSMCITAKGFTYIRHVQPKTYILVLLEMCGCTVIGHNVAGQQPHTGLRVGEIWPYDHRRQCPFLQDTRIHGSEQSKLHSTGSPNPTPSAWNYTRRLQHGSRPQVQPWHLTSLMLFMIHIFYTQVLFSYLLDFFFFFFPDKQQKLFLSVYNIDNTIFHTRNGFWYYFAH